MAKLAKNVTTIEIPTECPPTSLDMCKIEEIAYDQILIAVNGDEERAAEVMDNWFKKCAVRVTLLSLLQDGKIKIGKVEGNEPCFGVTPKLKESLLPKSNQ